MEFRTSVVLYKPDNSDTGGVEMCEVRRKGGSISGIILVLLSSSLIISTTLTASVLANDSLTRGVSDLAEHSNPMTVNEDELSVLPCSVPDGDIFTTMLEYQGYLYIGSASASNHPYIYRYDPVTDVCTKWKDAGVYFVYSSGTYGGVAFWGNRGTKRSTTGPLLYFDGTTFGSIPEDVWFSSTSVSGWIEDFKVFNDRLYAAGTICTSIPGNSNYFFVKYCDNAPCMSAEDWHWTNNSRADIGRFDDGAKLEEFNGNLYLSTYDSASVLRYYPSNNTWWYSLGGAVDGDTEWKLGGHGIFGLVNYSGHLHALSYRWGWHWKTQDGMTWTGENLSYEIFTRGFVFENRIYAGASEISGHNIVWYDGTTWSTFVIGTVHFRYFAMCGINMCTTSGNRVYYIEGTAHAEARLDIDPNTLNLKSGGRWITAYITTENAMAEDIDPTSLLLNEVIEPEWWGIQNDTTLTVKFSRSAVQAIVSVSEEVDMKVTGQWKDGEAFELHDVIRVIDVGDHREGRLLSDSRGCLSSHFREEHEVSPPIADPIGGFGLRFQRRLVSQ